MRKRGKKLVAMALATSMALGSVSMQAFADEPVDGTVIVNNDDNTISEIATKTEETVTDEEKITTVTVTENISGINKEEEVLTGTIVKVAETITDLTGEVQKTSSTEEGEITKTGEKEPVAGEDDVTLGLKEGEKTSAKEEVELRKETTEFDENLGTDVTITTEETPREVEGTMGNIETFKGDGKDVVPDGIEPDVEAVNPEWNENKEHVKAPTTEFETLEEYQEALQNKPDGYDFLYTGKGEDSLYGASWGFWDGSTSGYGTPVQQFQMTDLSDTSVFDSNDPNWQEKLDIHTGYCVDLETGSKSGYWYNIENLEDAGYYQTEEAEDHIRAITLNGYWGTVGTQKDANGNDVPKTGSLEAMKAMLKGAQDNGALEGILIDDLTEGEALVATQMAIWKYGNPYQEYTDNSGRKYAINLESNTLDMRVDRGYWTDWVSSGTGKDTWIYDSYTNELGMTDEEIEISLNRINAVYGYLIGLSMTAEEAGTTEVITEEKIVKVDSLSMTVGEKASDYEANTDDNDDNDVYDVSLSFALVVEPNKDKDDLVVKVVRMVADGQGNIVPEEVAKARLAGNAANDDSSFSTVVYDEATGSYTLKGLELAENANCEFSLKLEGVQYLEQGVYIYSSEVRDNKTSQTFVGIAEGYKSVDVGMKVDLCFNVKEGTVTETRKWEKKSNWENNGSDDDDGNDNDGGGDNDDGGSTPEDPIPVTPQVAVDKVEFIDSEVPLSDMSVLGAFEIEDDMIPLGVLPATGDNSLWLMIVSLFSGLSLAGASFVDKMKKRRR